MEKNQAPEIVGIRTMLEEFHPPLEYFLRPLVFPGSLMMLYAAPGLGKTFAALGIASAVASCGSFLKWRGERPGRVWYIENEIGAPGMQRRAQKINPDGPETVTDANFRFTRMRQDRPQLCISNPKHHKWVIEKAKDFDFIVFDNYGCLTQRRGDESDVSIWARVKPLLLRLRALGKSVLMVDHGGKSGDYLGTSEKAQPLDWLVKLSRTSDYEPGAGAKFLLEFQKERDGWGEDISPIVVTLLNSEYGMQWEWINKSDYILGEITRMKTLGMTDPQIAKELSQPLSLVKSIKPEPSEMEPVECGRGGFTYDGGNADELF